jgi:ribA/ribD-fused uncharacterized protein
MADPIAEFSGEHRWLSNFWPCPMTGQNGLEYPSVEHAYQACKFRPGSDEHEACRTAPTAAAAKKLAAGFKKAGKELPGFQFRRMSLMLRLLRLKFAFGTPLALRLTATWPAELVEGNTWGDTFWGVCRGKGENRLGQLLMTVRLELLSQSAS